MDLVLASLRLRPPEKRSRFYFTARVTTAPPRGYASGSARIHLASQGGKLNRTGSRAKSGSRVAAVLIGS